MAVIEVTHSPSWAQGHRLRALAATNNKSLSAPTLAFVFLHGKQGVTL